MTAVKYELKQDGREEPGEAFVMQFSLAPLDPAKICLPDIGFSISMCIVYSPLTFQSTTEAW